MFCYHQNILKITLKLTNLNIYFKGVWISLHLYEEIWSSNFKVTLTSNTKVSWQGGIYKASKIDKRDN